MSVKSPSRSLLLDLPGELRNRIYRFTFNDNENVTITSGPFAEPALLLTCKQIRKEVSSIFYNEREFSFNRQNFTSTPYMLRVLKGISIEKEFDMKRRTSFIATLSPNWSNFLVYLRRLHKYKLMDGASLERVDDQGMPRRGAEYYAVYKLIEELYDLPWSRVEWIPEGQHRVFVETDPRWRD